MLPRDSDGRLEVSTSPLSKGIPKDVLCGVVGVLLRDLEVGNTGNALSCGSGRASGDGERDANGAVALRNIFLCGDFLPLKDEVGEELSLSFETPLVAKGGLGGGGISSDGIIFFNALPGVDDPDTIVSNVLERIGRVLPAPREDGVGPIRGRVEGAKGPSSSLDLDSMAGGAAELV